MWDGRLANLEEQALGPIQSPGENADSAARRKVQL